MSIGFKLKNVKVEINFIRTQKKKLKKNFAKNITRTL